MSWVLEAIEKAALERARRELDSNSVRVFGMDVATMAALREFVIETLSVSPEQIPPIQLLARLRAARK